MITVSLDKGNVRNLQPFFGAIGKLWRVKEPSVMAQLKEQLWALFSDLPAWGLGLLPPLQGASSEGAGRDSERQSCSSAQVQAAGGSYRPWVRESLMVAAPSLRPSLEPPSISSNHRPSPAAPVRWRGGTSAMDPGDLFIVRGKTETQGSGIPLSLG